MLLKISKDHTSCYFRTIDLVGLSTKALFLTVFLAQGVKPRISLRFLYMHSSASYTSAVNIYSKQGKQNTIKNSKINLKKKENQSK
jgi:hypothetical protein